MGMLTVPLAGGAQRPPLIGAAIGSAPTRVARNTVLSKRSSSSSLRRSQRSGSWIMRPATRSEVDRLAELVHEPTHLVNPSLADQRRRRRTTQELLWRENPQSGLVRL